MKLTTKRPGVSAWLLLVGVAGGAALVGTALAQDTLPAVPVPPENPQTEAKRVLGKMLFWDEQLSTDNTTSCATCHQPAAGGADSRRTRTAGPDGLTGTADDVFGSPGVIRQIADGTYFPSPQFGFSPQVTGRATPTAITAQFADEMFWDGRATSRFVDPETGLTSILSGGALESQAVGPPLSDVEMGHEGRTFEEVTEKLRSAKPMRLASDLPADVFAVLDTTTVYPDLFETAFGDRAVTADRIAKAIAVYERTLVADETPWDQFTRGDGNALTAAQQNGLFVFQFSGCIVCHAPPLFSDRRFRAIGVRPPSEDRGRADATGLESDRGKFKVPSLRNAGLRPGFMHNGMFSSVQEVVGFYSGAPGTRQFTENQDPAMRFLFVPPFARANVADFVTNGLTDPRVAAETFPFDRPTLFADGDTPNPSVSGTGVAGAGGLVPGTIAVTPPNLGNDRFKLGLTNALGGTTAWLAETNTDPAGSDVPTDVLHGPFNLPGDNPGEGFATHIAPVPDDVALDGSQSWYQWRVDDPAASGGVALSPVIHVTRFDRASPVTGAPPDPDPDPGPGPGPAPDVVLDDAVLAMRSARLTVRWNHHARGRVKDSLKLIALVNPCGADSPLGARVHVEVGGVVLIDGAVLGTDAKARSDLDAAVNFRVSYDVTKGRLKVAVKDVDLRAAAGLDRAGEVSATLDVTVRVEGISLKTEESTGRFELAVKGRDVRSTRGRFTSRKGRALDGAFRVTKGSLTTDVTGARTVILRGAMATPARRAPVVTGPLTLRIGDAQPIVVAQAFVVASGRKGGFAFDRRRGIVAGLRKLKFDVASSSFTVVTEPLTAIGLSGGDGARIEALPVTLDVPTTDGVLRFRTTAQFVSAGAGKRRLGR